MTIQNLIRLQTFSSSLSFQSVIMPHKSSCVGRYPAHPASKNAKDKSNGASLLSRTKVHIQRVKNGRNSRCSSEKDSGYSGKTHLIYTVWVTVWIVNLNEKQAVTWSKKYVWNNCIPEIRKTDNRPTHYTFSDMSTLIGTRVVCTQ